MLCRCSIVPAVLCSRSLRSLKVSHVPTDIPLDLVVGGV
jgi:hypothetical protein